MHPYEAVKAAQSKLDELRANKQRLTDEVLSIESRADSDTGLLTAGDKQRWNNVTRAIDRVNAEIADADAEWRDAMLAYTQASPNAVRSSYSPPNVNRDRDPWEGDVRYASPADLRGRALTAIETAAERGSLPSDDAETVSRWVQSTEDDGSMSRWALASSNPYYARAFASLLRDPQRGHLEWSNEEREAFVRANEVQRAMAIGSPSAGGVMVPTHLDPTVILTNDGTRNPFRQIARRVVIATSEWNGVSSAGVTVRFGAEASTATNGSPTLAQPSIPVEKMDGWIPFSIEAGEDIENLTGELRRIVVDAVEVLEAEKFTKGAGSGSSEPRGLITAVSANTNSEIALTTTGTFSIGDVYRLSEALPPRFWASAAWGANRQVLNRIRRFGEGTTGSNSAFWADLGADTPPLLLGKPVHEVSDMDTFTSGSTAPADILVVGAWDRYVVVDRVGTTFEIAQLLMDASTGLPTGQRGLYMHRRVGGGVVDDGAFRLLVNTN